MKGLEKQIEKSIVAYLKNKWAIVETMNWWSIMIKKWKFNHKMNLQTKGCPDILVFSQWHFIGIEVKKDLKTVKSWLKLQDRYKQGEQLPKSYEREKSQIEYAKRIVENGWTFILTNELNEVKEFIEWLVI